LPRLVLMVVDRHAGKAPMADEVQAH